MEHIVTAVGTFVAVVFVMVFISLLAAWPTVWLVNYIFAPSFITVVFGVAQLTFWKAFCFNWLVVGLFKSVNSK